MVAENSTSNKIKRGGVLREDFLSLTLYVSHPHLNVTLTTIIPTLDHESFTNLRSPLPWLHVALRGHLNINHNNKILAWQYEYS